MQNSVILVNLFMQTTITTKGQVTIPKHIRDALNLLPGACVEFGVNSAGEVVLAPAKTQEKKAKADRFERARGLADVQWRTDDLMKLLRADE
jgi:antitoxin PrlF